MIEQIVFTIIAFILFIYIFCSKLIKKNDTTYLIILGIQAIGILLNFLKINFDALNNMLLEIILYISCIILPMVVLIAEHLKINISEILKIAMADSWLLIGNTKKAKRILVDLVNKYNNSYSGHKKLAQIYENEGGMRKAIDGYVKVLEIKNNDYNSYYKISVLLNELGKKEEAIEMLETLLKNKQMYEASKLLGAIYTENKEYKKAIEVYTKVLKIESQSAEIYYSLGICYSMINDFENARKSFNQTVDINNNYYSAYYKLGQIALLYRDFDDAEKNFLKSTYKEKEAKAYLELAKIYIIKNQKEKAKAAVYNAIKADSDYYEVIIKEPVLFPIKKTIKRPKESKKTEYIETEQEKQVDLYLKDTYNLTKVLSHKKHKK